MKRHWKTYGRNFYCRYDYDGVDAGKANDLMKHLRSLFSTIPGQTFGDYQVKVADEFTYLDPVDQSVSRNQGIRILFSDGSRIVFRLSGTAGSGATVRMYLEKYESDRTAILEHTSMALRELVEVALTVSRIREITGFADPTVIT